jgi:hypothetical protein
MFWTSPILQNTEFWKLRLLPSSNEREKAAILSSLTEGANLNPLIEVECHVLSNME